MPSKTQSHLTQVQNGTDGMEAGGTLTLRSRMNKQLVNGRQVAIGVIDVADQRKGISPEVQTRLFDLFFTTKAKGTGLWPSKAVRCRKDSS